MAGLVGYALLAKQKNANEWSKRTTYRIDKDVNDTVRAEHKSREDAEHGKTQWQNVEPDTSFKVIPWQYGDDVKWANGSFQLP